MSLTDPPRRSSLINPDGIERRRDYQRAEIERRIKSRVKRLQRLTEALLAARKRKARDKIRLKIEECEQQIARLKQTLACGEPVPTVSSRPEYAPD